MVAISQWALVVVGIVTAGFICWQAVETRRATQQMSRSATATEENVRAFIQAQKPQIVVRPHGNPPADLSSATPRVQVELSNKGPTTAFDLVYESWVEVLPFPFIDFSPAADHHKSGEPLAVYTAQEPIVINIPLTKGLSGAELHELKTLKKFACVRFLATYRDAFSPKRHWASFGLWIQKDGLGFLRKYNDCGDEA